MKIAIITKYDQPQISENVVRLLSQLSQMHQIVLLPELAAHHFQFPHDVAPYSQFKEAGVQAAVSIGGDGTMLGAAQHGSVSRALNRGQPGAFGLHHGYSTR